MLVSAISANHYNVASYKSPYSTKQDNKADKNVTDTAFNSLPPNTKIGKNNDRNLNEIYKSINEWKSFCHEQIMAGKLNIIA